MRLKVIKWQTVLLLSFIILGGGGFSFYYFGIQKGQTEIFGLPFLYVISLIWILVLFFYIYISLLKEKILVVTESSELFKNLIVSAFDPIVIFDKDCQVFKWNKAAENLFGNDKETIKKAINLLIPDSLNCNFSNFLGNNIEVQAINKNNESFPVEISAESIVIQNNEFISLTIKDIKAKKEAELNLANKASELENSKIAIVNVLEDVEKEKARSEALLSGIGDGVVALDNDFNVIFINKVVEEQSGWSASELINHSFYDIVKVENNKGEPLENEKRPFYLSLKSGERVVTSVSDPNYFIKKDGTKFPAAITITPVKINDEVLGAIGVFRDITHEIEVDKMKSEFVSLVSHQLRTPLSAMRWYAEMLLNGDAGKLTEDQTDFVENIYKSNERMINLVNSLLNISRIESGRIIIEPKPTDLKELIDEVMSEVKTKFDEKQQTVLISIHPDLGPINLDPKLIFQVYKNLLTNANKYTPDHGQIEIFISKKGEDVISRVTDNGYGISKKDQSKIFEKFHRAENILKLETDGTGLGLYLAKAIVESSGGQIGFESEENKGTTFWFTLPIKGIPPKKGEVSLTN